MTRLPRFSSEVPSATYRLQFNRDFTFRAGVDVVDYLHELGVSHCYASPLFEARPESTHGYDICSFEKLNPRLGTAAEFETLVQRLHQNRMGLLLDMVPNHMAADSCNPWWVDVLENGQSSSYARWFDIEWEAAEEGLHHQVLLPILEEHYARVLEAGKLKISFEAGRFSLRYHDRRLPLSPASRAPLVAELIEASAQNPQTRPFSRQLQHLLERLQQAWTIKDGEALSPLQDELERFIAKASPLQALLTAQLARLNGEPGNPASFAQLQSLLQTQNYRLAYWKTGSDLINYRRFFDVAELVSLRMELPEVFEATHHLLLELVSEGKVNGLRIDHPDGLWDPREYLERLKESCVSVRKPELVLTVDSRAREETSKAEDKENGSPYIVVEKILSRDEQLPPDWPTAGTTGYDFLNLVNGLFVNRAHRSEFDTLYTEATGSRVSFESVVGNSKKQVLSTSFSSELTALARLLRTLAASNRYGQDFSFRELRQALFEIMAAFPVYRTYISETTEVVPEDQEHYIRHAIAGARTAKPGLDPAVLEFIEKLLLLSPPGDLPDADRPDWRRFVMKWQQLTGPVTAKGVEDTAFYNFNRLISLNEVGGDPDRFGTEVLEFHAHNEQKAALWPHSLLATATHDTKRGEDARARIDVLSEIPEEWSRAVAQWQVLNQDKKSLVHGEPTPHRNDEYLLYQTLVGAWPAGLCGHRELSLLATRLTEYLRKAVREAKAHTSWIAPVDEYEEATLSFAERLLENHPENSFLRQFRDFQPRIAFFGKLNSLSQTLLKMTAPGVPDFYQGAELWDFSLVDPDNRRPVDYALRRHLLEDLKQQLSEPRLDMPGFLKRLLRTSDTGQIKLYLIWRTLQFRLRHRELFQNGSYVRLEGHGSQANHLCAFARSLGESAIVVIAPRLVAGLTQGAERLPLGKELWLDTSLDLSATGLGRSFRNVLTDESLFAQGSGTLEVSKALSRFPVALLQST